MGFTATAVVSIGRAGGAGGRQPAPGPAPTPRQARSATRGHSVPIGHRFLGPANIVITGNLRRRVRFRMGVVAHRNLTRSSATQLTIMVQGRAINEPGLMRNAG